MIRGTVNYNNEAIVPLRFRGPTGTELDVDTVVDTGYTGILTLPPAIISALNLVHQIDSNVRFADGTVRQRGMFAVEVEWDGVWRNVLATEVDCDPLLGMSLLAGHELFIELVPGGVVDITKLP
jgi:clan AA aspartic protease